MPAMGLLETMAKTDLDALMDEIARHYRPGAYDALEAADPEWRASVERLEREVGGLYERLRGADQLLAQWRQAMSELYHLWRRIEGVTPASRMVTLEEVA